MNENSNQSENYFTGKLLLAMPSMSDARFKNAVIYLCSHDENGAMGLVINRQLPQLAFKELVHELPIETEIKFDPASLNIPIMAGGPVDAERGFLLHSNDFQESETIHISDAYSITGTVSAIKAVAEGSGPDEKLFILGYAGWSAGQLEDEIQQNAWLLSDADPALIFGADHDDKWQMAIHALGFDPAMLSGQAGRA